MQIISFNWKWTKKCDHIYNYVTKTSPKLGLQIQPSPDPFRHLGGFLSHLRQALVQDLAHLAHLGQARFEVRVGHRHAEVLQDLRRWIFQNNRKLKPPVLNMPRTVCRCLQPYCGDIFWADPLASECIEDKSTATLSISESNCFCCEATEALRSPQCLSVKGGLLMKEKWYDMTKNYDTVIFTCSKDRKSVEGCMRMLQTHDWSPTRLIWEMLWRWKFSLKPLFLLQQKENWRNHRKPCEPLEITILKCRTCHAIRAANASAYPCSCSACQ